MYVFIQLLIFPKEKISQKYLFPFVSVRPIQVVSKWEGFAYNTKKKVSRLASKHLYLYANSIDDLVQPMCNYYMKATRISPQQVTIVFFFTVLLS